MSGIRDVLNNPGGSKCDDPEPSSDFWVRRVGDRGMSSMTMSPDHCFSALPDLVPFGTSSSSSPSDGTVTMPDKRDLDMGLNTVGTCCCSAASCFAAWREPFPPLGFRAFFLGVDGPASGVASPESVAIEVWRLDCVDPAADIPRSTTLQVTDPRGVPDFPPMLSRAGKRCLAAMRVLPETILLLSRCSEIFA